MLKGISKTKEQSLSDGLSAELSAIVRKNVGDLQLADG